MIQEQIELKQKQLNNVRKEYEKTPLKLINEGFQDLQETWYGPHCYFENLVEEQLKFATFIGQNYYEYKNDLLKQITTLKKEIKELEEELRKEKAEKNCKLTVTIGVELSDSTIFVMETDIELEKNNGWL